MSSLINKVKEAISSDKDKDTTTHHENTGTATEPRRHDNLENTSRPTEGTFTQSQGENYAMGQEANRGFDGPAKKTDGPHKSDMLNKMDPRVDSDGDRSKNMGMNPPGDATTGFKKDSSTLPSGDAHSGLGGTGTTRTTEGFNDNNIREGEFGPHSSRTANAADPRVDSDLDSRRTENTGLGGTSRTAGGFENTGNAREGEFGPHSSRMANAADPRVDSDLDSRRTRDTGMTGDANIAANTAFEGSRTHESGLGSSHPQQREGGAFGSNTAFENSRTHETGLGSSHPQQREGGAFSSNTRNDVPEGEFGPHSSRMANAADPRVDSDRDNNRRAENQGFSSTTTGGENFGRGSGPGPAPNTAGPHSSDLANKADPRVDSDLDNSKTVGGDKTFEQGSNLENRDPTDAAQVPPSVLQKHVGKPVLMHDDATHDRTRRHSTDKREGHHGL